MPRRPRMFKLRIDWYTMAVYHALILLQNKQIITSSTYILKTKSTCCCLSCLRAIFNAHWAVQSFDFPVSRRSLQLLLHCLKNCKTFGQKLPLRSRVPFVVCIPKIQNYHADCLFWNIIQLVEFFSTLISSISLVVYSYICLVFHSFILLHMYINCFILLYTYFKFIHVKRFWSF